MPYASLRDFIARLEREGRLVRVREPVSPVLEMTEILETLEIHPDRMRENLDVGGGLAFSQNVLLALVDAGMARDEAYAIVQASAARAWDEGLSFREVVERDERVRELIGGRLDKLFDPARAIRNLDVVFDRLEKVEVRER